MKQGQLQQLANGALAICLALMAIAVFINVVLRYGFGSGIAASEEVSRLLFVWMVFIGATAAYPASEHMAFTSLVAKLRSRPAALLGVTLIIRFLVLAACGLVAFGAWNQILVGAQSKSVVLGYPSWLLPLPAFLCCLSIASMALVEIIKRTPLDLGPGLDVE